MFSQFGGKPTQQDLKRYSHSSHFADGEFRNVTPVKMHMNISKMPSLLYKQFIRADKLAPDNALLIEEYKKTGADDKLRARWYGHSVLFMELAGQKIFIDPMFGQDAAPISPFPVKRFSKDTMDILGDLPGPDLVLISHDHYDHLDYGSIMQIKDIEPQFLVAMGVKRHLVKWGIDPDTIREFDWWETYEVSALKITFTPTRHFAGRGIRDRNKSFWGGWNLKTPDENIWFSGDGGYGEHFKEIGEKLGPFDIGFMECGQYSDLWPDVHMRPEESVRAALDARVEMAMPVHWAGFTLAQHKWTEPAERFVREAEQQQLKYLIPRLGQAFSCGSVIREKWW